MIRTLAAFLATVGRWPRTSGDDPDMMDAVGSALSLAPHERG